MNKIYLVGDSTCQINKEDTFPQKGWGQVFKGFVKEEYQVINLAKNGRSTKSFIDEGLFKEVEENISEGDYLFIEFGHNDEKSDLERHTDPFTTYQENLLFFANTARKVNATPIIMSSIYRRHFDENGKILDNVHFDYPQACEELCKRENIAYIDVCELTKQLLISLGDEASKELFMVFPANVYTTYPEGKTDNTHLRYRGALEVSKIIVNELEKLPEFAKILK